jgi:hypothetical protein
MDDEVYGAQDKRGIDERRNALYANTSTENVKVVSEKLENKKNGGVHDNNTKAERKDNNRSENKREDWLQDGVQEHKNERNKNEFKWIGGNNKTRNAQICKPKPESVSRDDNDDS